jgi:hypothetical protein
MDFAGHEGWLIGYIIGLVVVLVVVALVVPILEGLENAERNTAGLAGLNETITSALAVIAGLKRGRSRLGG